MDIHRATIIVDDNMVLLNQEGYNVDVNKLISQDIYAVQWYADEGFGEVEFKSHYLKDEKRWDRKPNEIIDSFNNYAWVIPEWEAAKAEEMQKREEAKVALEAAIKKANEM